MNKKRKIRENKRAAMHIEMIISFVLFLTFVGFLLLVVRPYGSPNLSGAVISSLHNSFRDYSKTNLTEFFLKANYSGNAGCFYFKLNSNLFVYGISKSLAKDPKTLHIYGSEIDAKNLKINQGSEFYKVYLSPEFVNPSLGDCDVLPPSNYTIGSIFSEKVVSNKSLSMMKDEYENNYENLKTELNFPKGYDFAIESDFITMKKLVPPGVEVKSDVYLEKVLFENGSIENKRFILEIW